MKENVFKVNIQDIIDAKFVEKYMWGVRNKDKTTSKYIIIVRLSLILNR